MAFRYCLVVPTIARSVPSYAAVTGSTRMEWVKRFRHLGETGVLSRGLPGRRSEIIEIDGQVSVIESMASDQPSGGPEAVRILDAVRCITNQLLNPGEDYSDDPLIPKGMTFRDFLKREIEAWIVKIKAGYTIKTETDPFIEPRQIFMVLNPPRAAVVRHVVDKSGNPVPTKFYSQHFVGPDPSSILGKNTPSFSRQTVITDDVLIVAAKLLIEARAKQSSKPIPKPASAKAGEGAGDSNITPKKVEAVRAATQDGLALVQPISASAPMAVPASRSASASSVRTNKLWSVNKTELMGPDQGDQLPLSGTCDHSSGRVRVEGGGFLTL